MLHQVQEVALTLPKAFPDGFDGVLRKLLVLNNEVMEVVSQVVGAGRPAMAVENSEEADLRPINVEVLFVFGLKNVQDYADAVFVIISYNPLIGVGSIRLDDSALLLTCFRWLVVFELDCARIQWNRVLAEK